MISGVFTLAAMTGFFCVTWWAYTRHNVRRFRDAAALPLDDGPAAERRS